MNLVEHIVSEGTSCRPRGDPDPSGFKPRRQRIADAAIILSIQAARWNSQPADLL